MSLIFRVTRKIKKKLFRNFKIKKVMGMDVANGEIVFCYIGPFVVTSIFEAKPSWLYTHSFLKKMAVCCFLFAFSSPGNQKSWHLNMTFIP